MIQATVSGNVGKDAETREVGPDSVTSFNVASNRKVKGQETTTWVRMSIWGRRGQTLRQHIVKGTKVVACGELSTREYEGKTYLEMRVNELDFLTVRKLTDEQAEHDEKKRNAYQSEQTALATTPSDQTNGQETDDIPF